MADKTDNPAEDCDSACSSCGVSDCSSRSEGGEAAEPEKLATHSRPALNTPSP
jgi:hypothetical protein